MSNITQKEEECTDVHMLAQFVTITSSKLRVRSWGLPPPTALRRRVATAIHSAALAAGARQRAARSNEDQLIARRQLDSDLSNSGDAPPDDLLI